MPKTVTYGDIQSATPEEDRKYYVYMWCREEDGEKIPVYIGMGSGNRWRTRSGRSKAASEYFKLHDCNPRILVKGLALTVACKLEEMVKEGMVKQGFKLLDGEHDLTQRKQRQRDGYDALPIVDGKRISTKTGKRLGRPKTEHPGFSEIAKKQKEGLITVVEACSRLGISRTQWYRLIKEGAE